MAAELLALLHSFDIGIALQDSVSEILGRRAHMKVYTDSQVRWDAVTSLYSTSEKRLLSDIYGIQEAFRTGVLENLCRIDSKWNPADAMTKEVPSDYFIEVLRSNALTHPVVQEIGHGAIHG
jgi:hypothetical protein